MHFSAGIFSAFYLALTQTSTALGAHAAFDNTPTTVSVLICGHRPFNGVLSTEAAANVEALMTDIFAGRLVSLSNGWMRLTVYLEMAFRTKPNADMVKPTALTGVETDCP